MKKGGHPPEADEPTLCASEVKKKKACPEFIEGDFKPVLSDVEGCSHV